MTQKKPQAAQKATPSISADTLREVLQQISDERRAAHASLDEAGRQLVLRRLAHARTIQEHAEHLADAKAAHAAHQRYKGKKPEQEWAAEERDFLAVVRTAQDNLDRVQYDQNREIGPESALQRAVGEAASKVDALRREWEMQARLAQAAGVDTAAFWTPEKTPAAPHGAEVA